MGSMSIWHWILVIGVVLLLFGRGKITELMGDVAQGIKAFKKGMAEEDKPEVQKTESAKTIEHQADSVSPDLKRRAAAETKIEGGTV
jgi:sec-independent protein translocase protein TatA